MQRLSVKQRYCTRRQKTIIRKYRRAGCTENDIMLALRIGIGRPIAWRRIKLVPIYESTYGTLT